MPVTGLHHVQLAMPRGREDDARSFYAGVLGFEEVPKPENLSGRGGAWFRSGTAEVHLGVEEGFRPARKAHPAFLVEDLAGLVKRCEEAGYQVQSGDEPLAGYDRGYIADPFGNRIEILHAKG
jgi:catechol 2,3-dioxygenase-like lactoylglutathione lyase family enzyme